MNNPKVLIIGEYFDLKRGGGITLTNLFKDWQKDSLAVASDNLSNPDFGMCHNYYQIGDKEFQRRFPFNLKKYKNDIRSEVLGNKDKFQSSSNQSRETPHSLKKKLYESFLYTTGLQYYRLKYHNSNSFLTWVRNFSPDFIYAQLSSIQSIDFVSELHKILKIPLAIHIMDDWPSTICREGLFKEYWHRIADRKFRKLLSEASILLSISEAMSEEYLIRYGYSFIPFHNPIDTSHWKIRSEKDYNVKGKFTILYAGRIGLGIQNVLFDIIKALDNLKNRGIAIEFQIQATNQNLMTDEFKKSGVVKLNPPVKYSELPEAFSSADLLLLANDFEQDSISFLRFSMPTKATEYMASGTPVLVYSHADTAITKHALKYKWAYVVSENNIEELGKAIYQLYTGYELRKDIGTRARNFAFENYDGDRIREKFMRLFNRQLNLETDTLNHVRK